MIALQQGELDFLHRELFLLGEKPVTLISLALFALVVAASIVASILTRRLLRDRLLRRTALDAGSRDAIGRIAGYLVFALGVVIGLSTLGFDLSSLAVLGGALGIGIGFGLQNIVNNFVSGLIILFERPITVGQRVEVGGTTGIIERIGARSTTIVTNDRITYIIPNSEFVSQQVINWSHGGDRRVRVSVPLGVSYGSDPRHVEKLLLQAARANEHVLKTPPPDVIFEGYGESSIDFRLRVWSETLSGTPFVLKSQLYFAIWDLFRAEGVEIPFPQRDLHVKGPLRVDLGAGADPASG